MKSSVKFDCTTNVVYAVTEGKATVDDLVSGLSNLADNEELPRDLRIIEDSRKVKAVISQKELLSVVPILEKLIDNYTSIFHAVIHTDQKNTAMSFLLNELIKNNKYHLQVFSTTQAAKDWIGIK